MYFDKLFLKIPGWDYFLRSITPCTVPKNVGIIYPVKSLKVPVSLMVRSGFTGIRLYASLFISEFSEDHYSACH